jgi:hypothetical protein
MSPQHYNSLPLPYGQDCAPRVLLTTQPKAGTYLYSEILQRIGFAQTYYHLGKSRLQAYDRCMLTLCKERPRLFDVNLELRESRRLIRTGEFAVGHLGYEEQIGQLFAEFLVIAIVRELRAGMTSYANWVISSGRYDKEFVQVVENEGVSAWVKQRGEQYIRNAKTISDWQQTGNALLLKFEEIHQSPATEISKLIDFLGVDTHDDVDTLFSESCKANTLTRSDAGSNHSKSLVWNQNAEKEFRRIGGPDANRAIGYIED